MSTHVTGFKPADEKWRAMKAVYDSCHTAKIQPPDEVQKYFDYSEPDDAGVEVEIPHKQWHADMSEGVEIDISTLDKDVKIIRFFNSY